MTIKIVTDSTCDLPQEIVSAAGISIVPGYVNFGNQSYLDGVEISRAEFYQRLVADKVRPTTSAPSTGAFLKLYHRLADEGATGILSIHISHKLSNIVNAARLASEEFTRIPITVIDSGQLTLGLGFLALMAAEAAKLNASMAELIEQFEQQSIRTFSYAKLDTVEFIRRGGRMNDFQHGLISMLDIRPILKMNNGSPRMEIVRTRKKAFERIVEMTRQLGDLEYVGIVHANAADQALEALAALKAFIGPDIQPVISDVSPVLGSHVGPGALCLVSMRRNTEASASTSPLAQIGQIFSSFTRRMGG